MTGIPPAEPPAGLTARLAAVLTPAVTLRLVDASFDGLALADADGALVLVNRRVEEMFGYDRAELLGSPLDHLTVVEPQTGRGEQEAGHSQQPATEPPEMHLRQAGLRKDGTTFPVEISLSLLATGVGELTIASFRNVTKTREEEGDPVSVTGAAYREHSAMEPLDAAVSRLFEVGLALQAAADLPADLVRRPILDAAAQLDEAISEIRGFIFAVRTRGNRLA